MVASIPNDIFQFSTASALMAGLAENGPQVAHLSNHGTHGIGTFSKMEGEMLMLDGVTWRMTADGKVKKAASSAQMPFVQVTIFQPEYRVKAPAGLTKEGLWDVFSSPGSRAGGKNSYMPFRLRGTFTSIDVRVAGGQKEGSGGLSDVAGEAMQKTLKDVKGEMFGFAGPVWSVGVGIPGLHCHFLSEETNGERTGGHVKDFVAKDQIICDWSVTGRFHLGLPLGNEWESLDLAPDVEGIKKAEE